MPGTLKSLLLPLTTLNEKPNQPLSVTFHRCLQGYNTVVLIEHSNSFVTGNEGKYLFQWKLWEEFK